MKKLLSLILLSVLAVAGHSQESPVAASQLVFPPSILPAGVNPTNWLAAFSDTPSYAQQKIRSISEYVNAPGILPSGSNSLWLDFDPVDGVVTEAGLNSVLAANPFKEVKIARREKYLNGGIFLYSKAGQLLFRGGWGLDLTAGGPLKGVIEDLQLSGDGIEVEVPADVRGVELRYSDERGGGTEHLHAENGFIHLPKYLYSRKGTVVVYKMDDTAELRDITSTALLEIKTLTPITVQVGFSNNQEFAPSANPEVYAEFQNWRIQDNGYTGKATFTVAATVGIARFIGITETKIAKSVKVRLLPNGAFQELKPVAPGRWAKELPGGTYDAIFTFEPDYDHNGKG